MSEIRVLDPKVAERIAAGEVVERPSSVVKELVENSIDAHAKSITVEIKNGGVAKIRVADDGCGIAAGELATAFLRHATSKVVSDSDLESISTLGFRGEALASIGAVSKTEVFSCKQDSPQGMRLRVEGGEALECAPAGCPVGTTFVVRELFYNTPARMKFLKRDSTEAGYILDVMQKMALSRPDISFRFINNGKEQFFTAGDSKLENTVYSLFGRDYAKCMIKAEYRNQAVRAWGLIGKSEIARANRAMQIFFVNGRPVVSKTLHAALAESYKNQLTTGKFPVCVLNVELNPQLTDVNVHPAKVEIKFANERDVYDAVYWSCMNALHERSAPPVMALPKSAAPKPDESAACPAAVQPRPIQETLFAPQPIRETASQPIRETAPLPMRETAPHPILTEPSKRPATYAAAEPNTYVVEKPAPPPAPEEQIHVVGQLFKTYIVVQRGEEALFIDQHAAHERLRYEALMRERASKGISKQLLITPLIIDVFAAELPVFEEHAAFFKDMGFELERFGNNTIIVREIPVGLSHNLVRETLLEVASLLKSGGKNIVAGVEERAMYQIACKSAIKANHKMPAAEMELLVKRALEMEGVNTCPHGRPICVSLSKTHFEKQFKRS